MHSSWLHVMHYANAKLTHGYVKLCEAKAKHGS